MLFLSFSLYMGPVQFCIESLQDILYSNSRKDVEVQVLSELTVRRAVVVGCYLLRTYFQVFPGNRYRRPSRTKFSVKWRSCDTISVKGVNECTRIVCLSLFLSYDANFNGFKKLIG